MHHLNAVYVPPASPLKRVPKSMDAPVPPSQARPVVDTHGLQKPVNGIMSISKSGTGVLMDISLQAKKLIFWLSVNLILSIIVWIALPISIAGISIAFPIFAAKICVLILINDYPLDSSACSMSLFLLSCLDVVVMFLFGSFSIFSLALSRVF